MHQAHNIPWHLIESNFKFVREDKRFTPVRSGLVPKENANPSQQLKHFVKKFVETIRVFSETERKKYPPKFPPLSTGNVFSDELREKHPDYLNERNQRIEYWIERFEARSINGELMDIVNILLYENEMSTLLMLAQHPQIRMAQLHYYSWGHHFGFRRTKESAVRSYLFFNAAEATGSLENGDYALSSEYASLIFELSHSMEYSAQQVSHIAFLRKCDAYDKKDASDARVHKDYGLLQEYLKTLFALMYRYDVLARESGVDPTWEEEIARQYPLAGLVKMEWAEGEKKWALV
ncbi:hypothetical protein BDZ97DRAFT_1838679 [Flammula alnicola]|nr:hypothetical protein BDZ97DRAFT_1838679 [Flammula alnicola]